VPSANPYALQVSASNILKRQVWVNWQRTARVGVNVDVIALAPPFSLNFYRELARNQLDGQSLQPLSVWLGDDPKVYLRTVDQGGNAVEADLLSAAADLIPRAVSDWSDGKRHVQTFERGTATRDVEAGWIIVNVRHTGRQTRCAQTTRDRADDALIELMDGACPCGTSGVPPRAIVHEVGHAMGFFHVSDAGAVMFSTVSSPCTGVDLDEAERVHVRVAVTRRAGNLDPDLDASDATPLAHRRITIE